MPVVGTPPPRPARTTRPIRQQLIAGAARALCLLTAIAGTVALAPQPAAAQSLAACPNVAGTVQDIGLAAVRDAVACGVNAMRAEQRLGPLSPSSALAMAAQRHGTDMIARRYFAHVSPGGGTVDKRARRAGYIRNDCWVVGENLGWTVALSASADAVVGAWMESPSHRAIILDPEFRQFGVAVVAGAPDGDPTGATFVLEAGSTVCAGAAVPSGPRARARARVRAG
ncbi:MAG: hypothetical protein QOD55_2512 [Solirubrobacteraceae bacterium]|nr:hypothetical protein [Solirubrobacteraceae bacterium]MEA2290515.1 hypothetical protein [Solirubrobacteraceae bacterium]